MFKRHFKILSTLLTLSGSLTLTGWSQPSLPPPPNINRLEYFFNIDPGVGNGTNITGVPLSEDVNVEVFNVSTASLGEGMHQIFVRAQDDKGNWSLTQANTFLRLKVRNIPEIGRVEYFIDNDPGFGEGTEIPPLPASDDRNINIILNEHQSGLRTLYVRAQNEDGSWGVTHSRTFQQFIIDYMPALNDLEWFIDNDPGFGNGAKLPLAGASADRPVQVQAVDLADIAPGIHTLYVRGRNELMQWGITNSITFVKTEVRAQTNISQLEYFIDKDPGVGRATPITIGAPASSLTAHFNIDPDTLSTSMHTLYVRAKDERGSWSIVQYIYFYKAAPQDVSKIDYLEYFIDTDPGFGNGTEITGIVPSEHIIKPFTVDLSAVAPGLHRLYIRARNEEGRWGITQSDMFMKVVAPTAEPLTAVEWFIDEDPGIGRANDVPIAGSEAVFSADFGDLPAGMHTLYVRARNAAGRWSITQDATIFRMTPPNLPDIVKMEYFISKPDEPPPLAPYFGAATDIPITPGQNISVTFHVNLPAGLPEDWYTFNVRAMDSLGNWSITQQQGFILTDRAKNAEATALEYFVDADPGFGNATRIPLASPNGQTLITINDGEYTEGIHTLYIRAQNARGEWSVTQSIPFVSAFIPDIADVVALEWFFDSDPGIGAANRVYFPVPGQLTQHTFNAPIPSSLAPGMHTFYVRAINETGAWSITHRQTFILAELPEGDAELSALEWFIDSDPGFGEGNEITVAGMSADSRFLITLSGDMAPGFHQLYIRARNAAGRWGVTHSIPLIVAVIPDEYTIPDVTALEWFIDNDPGIGAATRVPVSNGQSVQHIFPVPVDAIAPGLHSLYIRAINEKGAWSITHSITFVKADLPANYELPALERLEWFIDIDPGFGNATPVGLTSETSLTTVFGIDLSTIEDGPHVLSIRAMNENGRWSHTADYPFYRTDEKVNWRKELVYLEYFIDIDPGFGNGVPVPIPSSEDVDAFPVFIPLGDIWPGSHEIYFRAKDVRGFWSHTHSINIVVIDNPNLGGLPDITDIEYFINEDPGFGLGKSVSFARSIEVSERFFIEIDTLPGGLYTLYFRARNSRGNWGHTHGISIYNTMLPQFPEISSVAAFEYFINRDPGFGEGHRVLPVMQDVDVQQMVTVNVDTLPAGMHSVFVRALDTRGNWSQTQRFSFIRAVLPKDEPIKALEWFIDADPGFGKANNVNFAIDSNIDQLINIALPADITAGTHTLYIRARNINDEWSITQSLNFAVIKIQPPAGIAALEYFIDRDPGFGEGEPISVPYGALSADVTAIIPLTDVEAGFHTLYVRAKNEDDIWSITQYMQFVVVRIRGEVKVVEMEYFIDRDPGFGNGEQITGIVAGTNIDKIFEINPDDFAPGMHTLYIRALDEHNNWSITHSLEFFLIETSTPTDIVKAEYFINNLVAFGGGIDIPISPHEQSIHKIVPVDVSALQDGLHTIFVRVMDSKGRWSITQYKTFLKQTPYDPAETIALEWFIDIDPGFGEANREDITPATAATVNIPIDLDDVAPGMHTLHVRAENIHGKWGITHDITFIKLDNLEASNISVIEWFIDTDPGFGASPDNIVYDPPVDHVVQPITINTSSLAPGIHTLYVRALNEDGRWSITQYNTFIKVDKSMLYEIDALEWFINADPGFGNATPAAVGADIPINTSALSPAAHTLYIRGRNTAGQWGVTQNFTFIKVEEHIAPEITAFEWFVDEDPGFGLANNVPVAGHSALHEFIFDIGFISDDDWHTLYMRALDDNNKWSITQNIDFKRFVDTTVVSEIEMIEWFVNEDPGFGNAPASQQITYDPPQRQIIHVLTVNTTGLSQGLHTFSVRARNIEGDWSLTQYEMFAIVPSRDVDSLEWFIDVDRGFGKNNLIPVTPTSSMVSRTISIPTASLTEGPHTLYFRARNMAGSWSITQYHSFIKFSLDDMTIPDIAKIEYFFNEDPGFGNGTVMMMPTDAGSNVTHSFMAIMPVGMPPGLHTLYVRSQDTKERWSHTQYSQFIKVIAPDPHDIIELEWFVDEDPGFGNATALHFSIGRSVESFINPGNVEPGQHTLYVRALNTAKIWSITQSIDFISIVRDSVMQITAMEYFFDNDPGFGGGTPVPIDPGTNIVKTFNVAIPSVMAQGIHTFYVRAMNEEGYWSITQYNQFVKVDRYVVADAVALEWFIDSDPGFGEGNEELLTSGLDKSFTVNLDTIPEGIHTLYIRAIDEHDRWGITHSIEFVKIKIEPPANVVAIEWFIDDDPGFGGANAIPPFAAAGTTTQTFMVTLTGIEDGVHTLYVRSLDDKGKWSITQYQSFVKTSVRIRPEVTAVEWFIGEDPGFGNANMLAVNPAAREFTLPFMVAASHLTSGPQMLYVRSLDVNDGWSITHSISLIVIDVKAEEIAKVIALEYFIDTDPGFGAGTPVNIYPAAELAERKFFVPTAHLGEGPHILYLRAMNEIGDWSITHYEAFMKTSAQLRRPDIIYIEYFFDDDPGFGNGIQVPVSPSTEIDQFISIDMSSIVSAADLENSTFEKTVLLYVRSLAEDGDWSITQYDVEVRITNWEDKDKLPQPVGGYVSANITEICQGSGDSVVLTATGYEKRIAGWQQRVFFEDGTSTAWTSIDGTADVTSITMSPSAVAGTWYYRTAIMDGDRGPAYSSPAIVNVLSAAQGGYVTASIPQYLCIGSQFRLTLEGYKGTIVRWQMRNTSTGDDVPWTNIDSTTASITVKPEAGGVWEYRAEVAMGACSNDFSTPLTANIVSPATGGVVEPAETTICAGNTFELIAAGYLGNILGWQYSLDEGDTWHNIIPPNRTYYFSGTASTAGEIHYRTVVHAGNCDTTYSEAAIIHVIPNIANAEGLNGPETICLPSDVAMFLYSVPEIAGVDYYEWTLPAGAEFVGASNGNEVNVAFDDDFESGYIKVRGISDRCGAGGADSLLVVAREKWDAPEITGETDVCIGETATYTATETVGATYIWDVPTGWTIVSENDNVIILTPSNDTPGVLSVTVVIDGCESEAGTLTISGLQGSETGPIYRLPNVQ